jgi:hypothetical protein
MKIKSALSILFAAAMMLTLCVTGAAAMGGDGSAENPLQIGTADELLEFTSRVNSGETTLCVELTDDITVENWSAIGGALARTGPDSSTKLYNGTFDGVGHTLTLSSPDGATTNAGALFGILNYDATVKNITLVVNFSGGYFTAGVAGINYGTISDVTVSGTIAAAGLYAGGIVGANQGKLYRCLNKASVSGAGNYVGGIAGRFFGIMQYCGNRGSVTGAIVGGLVGGPYSTPSRENPLTISITDSYNAGSVTSNASKVGNHASGLLGLGGWDIAYAWETGYFSAKNLFTYGEISSATSDASRYLIDGTASTTHSIPNYLKSYQNIYWREGTAYQLFSAPDNYISENYSGNTELQTLVLRY